MARLRLKSPLLPLITLALLAIQIAAPYDGWLMLLVGLGGAWLAAYLWARRLAQHLGLQRERRYGWAQVGDQIEERFTITNHDWLPVAWVEILDQSTLPGYQVSRVTGIEAHARNQWKTEGTCSRRGLFSLGPTRLVTGDPLGIYQVELDFPAGLDMLVTPPVVPLPPIEVAAGGRAGEGRPRPNALEQTVSVSTIRPYTQGDSTRWIHWPTSARHDQLFVRLFDSTPASDWWIILDMGREALCGQGANTSEEHGVILAASLAAHGLQAGRAVGLVANSAALTWLAPRQGDSQRWEILHALALVTPSELPLADMLARMRPAFGRNTSLIIITPDTNPAWITALLPLLRLGAVPTVLIQDPATFEAPAVGGLPGQAKTQPGTAPGLAAALAELGIRRYILERELMDRPEARPGRAGHLDWRFSPTGKAILVNQPEHMEWQSFT